ncbi:MAG: sugar-binding transcriptional regulator [Eubacteriales bacterium]
MRDTLNVLKKIIPNEINILQKRYTILKGIENNGPIGRRHLSQILNFSEKTIRKEVEFLKVLEFVQVSASGMSITKAGSIVLDELETIIHQLRGLSNLEIVIKSEIKCQDIIIVPGDIDEDDNVKISIGKAAAAKLLQKLHNNCIVAITGGSTAFNVVHAIKPQSKKYEDVLILPARGSLRNNVEYQANTLASVLADRLKVNYDLLNIPDNLSRKALDSVRNEPDIQKIIKKILESDIILFGIGNANEMAKRRNLQQTKIDFLKRKKAVAEALGYYFNKNGEIVYTSRSIGIKLEQMKKISYPIAVAGGKSKAKAILAVRDFIRKGCLVIDEGAANEIIKILNDRNIN